jgi:hypothetical protein
MTSANREGTIWVDDPLGVAHLGRWNLEQGVVSLYVGDFGPMATLVGGLPPESVARMLMRDFLDGRQAQEEKLIAPE